MAPKLTVLFVNDGKGWIRLLRILHKTGSMIQRECALRFLPSITERCRGWDRARTSPWRDTTWEMELVRPRSPAAICNAVCSKST